jgi:N-acetylneuraminic acid mutarotase
MFNPTANTWTWMTGSSVVGAGGTYGTPGVATASNVPGSRFHSNSWTDASGNLWLFGGSFGSSGSLSGSLNDMWEFNPTTKNWVWVDGSGPSGSEVGTSGLFVGASGVYGTIGTAAASNVPGSRKEAASWTDNSGNFWLFGGSGYDSGGTQGTLNDLWEFNPTTKMWTWISGSSTANAKANYGTLGTSVASNTPGSRSGSVGWTDKSGNFWIFGGNGYDSTGASGTLNLDDLWSFSATTKQWTWMGGSSTGNASGVYGTMGVAAAANAPGPRSDAARWIDSNGNLWLSGGVVSDLNGATVSYLNDRWSFNTTTQQWTWMGGANTINAGAVYGTMGDESANNVPGSRSAAVSLTDSNGNFWLFGGTGDYNSATRNAINLNDLWRYKP